MINRPASEFVEGMKNYAQRIKEGKKECWEVCNKADLEAEANGGERKRRLVSLFEANEVAKRVAGGNGNGGGRSRWGGRQVVVNGGLVDGEGARDVVSEWMIGN